MGDGESMDFLYTSKTAPVVHVVCNGAARTDEGTTGQKEVQGFGGRFREWRPFNWVWGNFGRWDDDQLLWLGGLKAPALVECSLKWRGDPCRRKDSGVGIRFSGARGVRDGSMVRILGRLMVLFIPDSHLSEIRIMAVTTKRKRLKR